MARISEGFLERSGFDVRVWAGLGQDLLRSLVLSHLFLSSGPPLAKAWDEILGLFELWASTGQGLG